MPEKPSKQRSALIGGLVIGAISGLPGLNLLNCCCCAGIIVGGAVAVYLYRQEFVEGTPPLESSDALVVGIMSGIIGALTTSILTSIVTFVCGPLESQLVKSTMEKVMQRLEDQGMLPPGTMDKMSDELEKSMEESRTFGGILRNLVFTLIVYPIMAMLGGLIGYGIFGRKKRTPEAQS
jgi:hypothetical protein